MDDDLYDPWIRALVRISFAAEKGVGVRLTWEECQSAKYDIDNWDMVQNACEKALAKRRATKPAA